MTGGMSVEQVEALAEHQWLPMVWGEGDFTDPRKWRWTWRCSCGITDRGTEAENPARHIRYETREDAARAAVEHLPVAEMLAAARAEGRREALAAYVGSKA